MSLVRTRLARAGVNQLTRNRYIGRKKKLSEISWYDPTLEIRQSFLKSLSPALLFAMDGEDTTETDLSGNENNATVEYAQGQRGYASLLGDGASTYYEEATTNFIYNPSFEVDTSDWETVGGAPVIISKTTSENALFGDSHGTLTVFAPSGAGVGIRTTHPIEVEEEKAYSLSSYLRWTGGGPGGTNAEIQLGISWYDSDGVLISSDHEVIELISSQWVRGTNSMTSPEGAVSVVIYIYLNGDYSIVCGVDGVQFEQSVFPTTYCDGSLGTGHSWGNVTEVATPSHEDADVTSSAEFPDTLSHTIAAGDDRLLLVGVYAYDETESGLNDVTGVTYNGVAMTMLGDPYTPDTASHLSVWYMLDPPVGTANVEVTLAGAAVATYIARSLSDANQDLTFGTLANATGSGTTPTVDVEAAVGDLVIDFVGMYNVSLSPGSGQTERAEHGADEEFDNLASSDEVAESTSVTMSWTGSGTEGWIIAAVAVKGSEAVVAGSPHAAPSSRIPTSVSVTDDESITDIFSSENGGTLHCVFRIDRLAKHLRGHLFSKVGYYLLIEDNNLRLRFDRLYSSTDDPMWWSAVNSLELGVPYALFLIYSDAELSNDPTIYLINLNTNEIGVLVTGSGLITNKEPTGDPVSDAGNVLYIGTAASTPRTPIGPIDQVAVWKDKQITLSEVRTWLLAGEDFFIRGGDFGVRNQKLIDNKVFNLSKYDGNVDILIDPTKPYALVK